MKRSRRMSRSRPYPGHAARSRSLRCTLSLRINCSPAASRSSALSLVGQMVAALEAAHKAGVIHRDFKSRNIILVPTAEGAATPRAVVTDFGLARGNAIGDSNTASITAGGDLVGTPVYMAPEQVEGAKITAAVDV